MRKLAGKNATPAAELKQFAKDKNLDLRGIEMDVTLDGSVQKAVAPLADNGGFCNDNESIRLPFQKALRSYWKKKSHNRPFLYIKPSKRLL